MKTVSITLALLLAAFGAGCSTTAERSRNLADPSVSGKTLALQVCSNCHGVDGNSVNPNFPKLSGQQKEYFVAQMKEFKGHDRLDPEGFEYMWGISRSLTEKQIDELASYFSQQKNNPDQAGDTLTQRESAGKFVFEQGVAARNIPPCSTCHGAEAAGNGTFPRLAGQHADYIVKQLNVFQRTDERPEGAIMKVIAHDLTSGNIENVAAYLSSHTTK
ncbi:MAG: cytochrome c4 [Betaproteobacteria bacterium]|nr:cytochrome c4 [Betaproteobacteria bacterium]